MFGNIRKMMEVKAKIDRFQKNLKKMEIVEEGMDGKVKVVVNGAGELKEVKLSEELFSGNVDVRKLERTIVNAINSAQRKAGELAKKKMQELLNELPPEVRQQLSGML